MVIGTYALINARGEVENVISWDGNSRYEVPPGFVLVPYDKNIHDKMRKAVAPDASPTNEIDDLKKRIAALEKKLK